MKTAALLFEPQNLAIYIRVYFLSDEFRKIVQMALHSGTDCTLLFRNKKDQDVTIRV